MQVFGSLKLLMARKVRNLQKGEAQGGLSSVDAEPAKYLQNQGGSQEASRRRPEGT